MQSKRGRKGGDSVATIAANDLFKNEVIGTRELRNNISNIIDRVVNNFQVVISGNVKKNSANKAAIISTAVLDTILKVYGFNPVINLDKTTGQYEVMMKEINVYGSGDTRAEAVQMLLELIVDSTNEYFENLDLYMRIPDMQEKLPYYLKIRQCKSNNELMMLLNLSNKNPEETT